MIIYNRQKEILQNKIDFLNNKGKEIYKIEFNADFIRLSKNNKHLTTFINGPEDNREDQAALYAYYYLTALCDNI